MAHDTLYRCICCQLLVENRIVWIHFVAQDMQFRFRGIYMRQPFVARLQVVESL